ncbi:TPA: hypothetical protein N0F65_012765 [Lagenidium giganteum]|uniref:Uncharacterized protein n=1 Tax=Lagenidium giganteum TaxID=4803 RepID=A0AAV2YE29_9STRA|nr:TPA: hypothetical protein N0F65_012765 [Lagenidium giganteum]
MEEARAAWDAWLLKNCFLRVNRDFYDVFELASSINSKSPLEAFQDSLRVRLCGPFEYLAAGQKVYSNKPLFLQGRFSLDPPEVSTVLADTGATNGAHYGLLRDAPDQHATYVVRSPDAAKGQFEFVGTNLFHALQHKVQSTSSLDDGDAKLSDVKDAITSYLEAYRIRMPTENAVKSKRDAETIAASLSCLGIVVPYDEKKVRGYRELPLVGQDLQDVITRASDGDKTAKKTINEMITRATIANDECDFGTSLLLGLDLFSAGAALRKEALKQLCVAYALLRRGNLYKIAHAHQAHSAAFHPAAPVSCISHHVTDDEPKCTEFVLPNPN